MSYCEISLGQSKILLNSILKTQEEMVILHIQWTFKDKVSSEVKEPAFERVLEWQSKPFAQGHHVLWYTVLHTLTYQNRIKDVVSKFQDHFIILF